MYVEKCPILSEGAGKDVVGDVIKRSIYVEP